MAGYSPHMIQRIVLIKLKDEFATADNRKVVADRTRTDLPLLERVQRVEVGVPGDDKARGDWDIAISVYFDDIADVPKYVVDPDHRRYVDEFLAPQVEVIKAWNFEI